MADVAAHHCSQVVHKNNGMKGHEGKFSKKAGRTTNAAKMSFDIYSLFTAKRSHATTISEHH